MIVKRCAPIIAQQPLLSTQPSPRSGGLSMIARLVLTLTTLPIATIRGGIGSSTICGSSVVGPGVLSVTAAEADTRCAISSGTLEKSLNVTSKQMTADPPGPSL